MIFGTPPIVTNGLVLHLDAGSRQSYPGSGTTWNDLSGNGYNGTLTNGPTFNTANQGSIVFDQANDIVSFSGVVLTNTHTVNIWIYPTSSDDYGTLFSQGQSTGVWYRGFTDKITFYYSGSDHLSNFTVTRNQWTNITVTCSSGNVNFYKNSTINLFHEFIFRKKTKKFF
jgi:hypothetical protein